VKSPFGVNEASPEINAGPETGTAMTYPKLLDVRVRRTHIMEDSLSSLETTRAGLNSRSFKCRNADGVTVSIC
jgi:hypothetical protein